ncbi:hypothetical protein [Rhizobium sp. AAP43]|uniref:hypothetical protein n=1 Tax=Rhizobium sp. AAP43 TaxID=1523420 RepID=UPI0006B90495|nr:hypothetical protein [Rhizobium sp. AAP43]KPF47090.1 hypothetical protein IP76_01990 [Rhizobium sp. AAP43]
MTSITMPSPAQPTLERRQRERAMEEYQAFRRLSAKPGVTITRLSQQGRPLAAPVARAMSLEEQLEAEMLGFEIDCALAMRRTEDHLQHSATIHFAISAQAFLILTLSVLAFVWLAARIATGV